MRMGHWHGNARFRQAGLLVLAAVGLGVCVLVATTPLTIGYQLLFGAVTMLFLVACRSFHGRRITLFLSLLAITVSSRYIYWRTTETLDFDNLTGWVLGLGLYLAELYAWLMLFFGFLHTIWPLERPIRPLREPPETWPTIDVFIPTYHESIVIVRDTVLAAMGMDYPRDKMRIYLLDDGRREAFRDLAAEAGIGYLTRPDNAHAKAGNLNNALAHTDGELIAVFDCDHVATRAFLQLTVGWFLDDPRLSLIQTPHHFYSPDPFERNLEGGRWVPNEGELFYGPVQQGNDLWNAAFFCGSCAVIRRSALDDIGGFAVETVTEDAHTALKLQRHGWNTAYLNIRLAAGLATERLAVHIGQRMRWARGMTQILRRDNPLSGPGLTLSQRLCYLSAMLHFQFALPRLVFLTAPLVYLLLGQSIITAGAGTLVAYALPHLFHAVMTTRRIHGRERLTFLGEIYETVLAFYLVGVTVRTFLDPRAGKFNVTHKGGLIPQDYFDARIVRPHMVTAGLLVLGCLLGAIKLVFWKTYGADPFSLVLNITWAGFSLVILLGAIAVGREARQVRRAFRVDLRVPAAIHLEDGHIVTCETENLSMGGVAVLLPPGVALGDAEVSHVELPCGESTATFPVRLVRRGSGSIGLHFEEMPLHQRRDLVRAVLGRCDAWTPETRRVVPAPVIHSLLLIIRSIFRLFFHRRGLAALAAVILAGALTGAGSPARAQADAMAMEAPDAATPPADTPPAPAPFAPAAAPSGPVRNLVVTFKDMGATNPLRLIGVHGEAWLPFSLRRDEVVTAAKLTLTLGYSPALLPELSHMAVFVNGELTGTIQLVKERSGGVTVTFPINPALFVADNKLNLQFIAHYTRDCEDPLHSTLWSQVSNVKSLLELTVQRLPARDDLASLPAPFFDTGDMRPLSLPFVLAGRPSDGTLKAGAAVAAYFGARAGGRGFAFPVVQDRLPADDAVVVTTADQAIPGLTLPPLNGPTLAVVPNPAAPDHLLLLVLGRTDQELMAAADTLAIGSQALSGASATVGAPRMPPREPYDAPRWLPTDRPVKLGELADPLALQGTGLYIGTLAADFRSAPDLFSWGRDGIPLRLRYRYPNGDWLARDLSRLDVGINRKFIKALPVAGPGRLDDLRNVVDDDFVLNEATVWIPPYQIFGQNQLQFLFDLKSNKKGACQNYLPTDVRSAIDPDSTIDLSGIHHFARFPNLGFFTGASFPFTRMADFSETAVILSAQPTAPEIEAFLVLMGRAGDATGVPPTGLAIVRGGVDTGQLHGRDILVVGSLGLAATLGDLLADAPFQVDDDMLRVAAAGPLESLYRYVGGGEGDTAGDPDHVLVAANDFTGLVSFRSPYDSDRVVVAVLAARAEALPAVVYALRDPGQSAEVGGDLAILGANGYSSYSVGDRFWRGDLPLLTALRWYLSERPLLMILLVLAAIGLLTIPVYRAFAALARRRLRRHGDEP